MKRNHLLPVIIATLAVFALLGGVIASAELQIGRAEQAVFRPVIDAVRLQCSGNDAVALQTREINERATALAARQCREDREGSHCAINTRAFYAEGDPQPRCTDEWLIHYRCLRNPEADMDDGGDTATRAQGEQILFLYEGQHTELPCPSPVKAQQSASS